MKIFVDPKTGATRRCKYVMKRGPRKFQMCQARCNGEFCCRHKKKVPKKPYFVYKGKTETSQPVPASTPLPTQPSSRTLNTLKINRCRLRRLPSKIYWKLVRYEGRSTAILRNGKYHISVPLPENMWKPAPTGAWYLRRKEKGGKCAWVCLP